MSTVPGARWVISAPAQLTDCAHSFDIPFGVTEYAEQSMETCAEALPQMRATGAAQMQLPAEYSVPLLKKRAHPVTVNPFHRPGQRPLPVVRMPNYYNGFAMPVVTKAS